MDIRQLVFTSLNRAIENGYETYVLHTPIEYVAADVIRRDADLENASVEEVIQAIKEFRNDRDVRRPPSDEGRPGPTGEGVQ